MTRECRVSFHTAVAISITFSAPTSAPGGGLAWSEARISHTEDSVGDPEDRECLTSTFSVEGTVYRQ